LIYCTCEEPSNFIGIGAVLVRDNSIDSIRFFGFLAVALLHTVSHETKVADVPAVLDHATRWAVPIYFMISGYLFESSSRPTFEKWWRMLQRLLSLFVFWELVYIAADFAIGDTERNYAPFAFLKFTLISGGVAWHLWFLPSLGACVTLFALIRRLPQVYILSISIVLFVVALLLNPYAEVTGVSAILRGLGFETGTLPSRNGPFFGTIFVAVGAFVASRDIPKHTLVFGLLAVAGFALQLFEAFSLARTGMDFAPFDFLLGTLPMGVFAFLALRHHNYGDVTAYLGRLALGMYCSHVLIFMLIRYFSPALADDFGFMALVAKYLITVVGALALTVAFARTPWLRRFVY
jgi:surface polysaccharide O-acyltransferase-like enzyme